MEEMLKVLKRKSQITYDMNCIEKYIKPGDCDVSLIKAWDEYKVELDEVEEELRLLSNPETKEFEEKKLEMLHKIEGHKREIHLLERQIKDIEKKIVTLV